MYVMQHYQMSWEDALHTVQNRRYCISPNGGFMTQIKVSLCMHTSTALLTCEKEYESIYKASVAVASNPARQSVVSRRKRDDEDDVASDDDRRRPPFQNGGMQRERDSDAMET